MTNYLLVVADHNDADYITKVEKISDKTLQKLKPLFSAIKKFKPYKSASGSGMMHTHPHNFPVGECCRTDLGEKELADIYPDHLHALQIFQDEYVPVNEYGIHTIKEIKLLEIASVKKLV